MISGPIREYSTPMDKDVLLVHYLDHLINFELCVRCIEKGYPSVMIDGSALKLEENIALTKRVVEFAYSNEVLGIENFMLKLYDDIELVEHIMDIFIDYSTRITKELSKRNIDCFWLDDDMAFNNGFLVQPEFIKDLWIPRTNKMLEPLKEKNIPIYMHCCANITDLIPIAIDLGIKAIHPLQPNCNDIYALKEKYGHKMSFVGNIDLAGVLSFGTPEEVMEDTRKHIDKLAPGGGYVVASSHSITDDVPPQNYIAMIETAQTYGKY